MCRFYFLFDFRHVDLLTDYRFYNLAAHPELVTELREEIRTVLAEHDNQFTSLAMQSMKKLDSFLKETLRVHPPAFGKSHPLPPKSHLLPTTPPQPSNHPQHPSNAKSSNQ
jgi:hypothetical protein